jgi:hypothetical protein
MARKAKTDTECQTFLEMANAWVQAAAIRDGSPPIEPLQSGSAQSDKLI